MALEYARIPGRGVRTLLIGGPKHGETIQVSPGEATWEFVESWVGRPWPESREYLGHVYAHDPTLDRFLCSCEGAAQVFTHAIIADDRHGGDRLFEADKAAEELEKAMASVNRAADRADSDKRERVSLLEAKESTAAALLDANNTNKALVQRLQSVRQLLEMASTSVMIAAETTGTPYQALPLGNA